MRGKEILSNGLGRFGIFFATQMETIFEIDIFRATEEIFLGRVACRIETDGKMFSENREIFLQPTVETAPQ